MVAMPTSGVLSVFNDLVEPFLKSIGRRGYESAVLAELRDALLPKLISGELRVPNAERILERAM
jgi:type I restriction enzyme S subunit